MFSRAARRSVESLVGGWNRSVSHRTQEVLHFGRSFSDENRLRAVGRAQNVDETGEHLILGGATK